MDSWQAEELAIKMKFIAYLMGKADNKGFTHGEKHHIIQTTLILLKEAQALISRVSPLQRNRVSEVDFRGLIDDVNELPS